MHASIITIHQSIQPFILLPDHPSIHPSIHPLTQRFYQSLCLSTYLDHIIGNVVHLQEYETERQRAVVPMIVATDLLNRLFSTSSMLPVAARTAGLWATNALLPLKVIDTLFSYAADICVAVQYDNANSS